MVEIFFMHHLDLLYFVLYEVFVPVIAVFSKKREIRAQLLKPCLLSPLMQESLIWIFKVI